MSLASRAELDDRPAPREADLVHAPAPVLVLGWGNRSRGDDALGPLAVDALRARWAAQTDAALRPAVEFLDDHQLAIEHALDLAGRRAVLWIDASRSAAPPFDVRPLQAERDRSFTSHALTPQAVMQVFVDLYGHAPPPGWLLGIAARRFELGALPCAQAMERLQEAQAWAWTWLQARVQADQPVKRPVSRRG